MGKKGKTTSRKKSKSKQSPRLQVSRLCTKKRCLAILSKSWTQFALFAGIVGFVFLVWPRLSVYKGEPLDPYKPFETPFVIRNDGYLPVFDISYDVDIRNLTTAEANNFGQLVTHGLSGKIPKLAANTSSTISFKRVVNAPEGYVTGADMYIDISYEPFLVPFSLADHRRFRIERKWNGQYTWNEYYSEK
jgi:hypothetical protein